MIPRRHIIQWRARAPWPEDYQVEQDLVIEQALVRLFTNPFLQARLAFRGGTALHKLYLHPPARYSEDIDLVQIQGEPIRETLSAIRTHLQFLGKPIIKQSRHNNTILYRFESEIPPVINLRLKIEINCREHFTVLGYSELDHYIDTDWFSGSCRIKTYRLEELLGTKLRALYQRKKGRDLFDLYHAFNLRQPDAEEILRCYKTYMRASVDRIPSRAEFLKNVELKLADPDFSGDLAGLLRAGISYNQQAAFDLIKSAIIDRL